MSAREIVRDGLGRVADMPVAKARVARLCLPGPMWYLAVCESCRWAGLSWKHRVWAEGERDRHNERKHATPFVYPEGAPQTEEPSAIEKHVDRERIDQENM